jgi:hypothetical protein
VERVAVRYKQVCWLEVPMSYPISVEVVEADEHLTRGADELFGLDTLEISRLPREQYSITTKGLSPS